MMNRYSLDRFKKAQSVEPFSVNSGAVVHSSASSVSAQVRPSPSTLNQGKSQLYVPEKPLPAEQTAQVSSSGGGQSSWQPPDWAVEPKAGLYWLDVVKDGEVVERVNLEKRRNIFGRQAIMCDFVLDHPSVSRQHAAVVQHKNGSVYVIDLGSVHGTFVANERLSKDSPMELEVGQSLRFAASTRSYVLRKGAPQVPHQPPLNVMLPPSPDPSDEEAVVAYNTLLNKLGLPSQNRGSSHKDYINFRSKADAKTERPAKKPRNARVTFRDQFDGVLVEVVGISDGADVSTEPGPLGVKEGSLVGRFDGLVEITVIPKDQDSTTKISQNNTPKGVTQKLQEYLEKVKSPGKGGLYEDLYGDALAVSVGSSWAKIQGDAKDAASSGLVNDEKDRTGNQSILNKYGTGKLEATKQNSTSFEDDLDDLFGDATS